MENTCKTCINNDDGLCDRKEILVEDEDFCEHHWAAGKKVISWEVSLSNLI